MSEGFWVPPNTQHHLNTAPPEWVHQQRPEANDAFQNPSTGVSWNGTSHSDGHRSYSNSPRIGHPPCPVPSVLQQPAFPSSTVQPSSQPPFHGLQQTTYLPSHLPSPSQFFDAASPSHRRVGSMPSSSPVISSLAGPHYLFQQSTRESPPPAGLGVLSSQPWPPLNEQHVPVAHVQQTIPSLTASYDAGSTLQSSQSQQPLPRRGYTAHPPSQQALYDSQHGRLVEQVPSYPHAISDQQYASTSSWQPLPQVRPIYHHAQPSIEGNDRQNPQPILYATQAKSYPHIESVGQTVPLYPLSHIPLPSSHAVAAQSQRHILPDTIYPPSLFSTGAPNRHAEAGVATAHPYPSVSISPVTNAMSGLSTDIPLPYRYPQADVQQPVFQPLGEDESYAQSSMTSPYSEPPSTTGNYMQMPYTPSTGQHSPAVGQLPQYPLNDYFVDYQAAPCEHVASPASQFQSTSAATALPKSTPGPPGSVKKLPSNASSKAKRQTRQYEGTCNNCQTHFATVTLRGLDADFAHPYLLQYYCLTCAPDILAVNPPSDNAASKADGKQKGKINKKRIRPTDPSAPALCDVCQTPPAYGGPVPLDAEAELTFHTEVVCDRCASRYTRCSDCGGGGGARAGVGKWRCKELFERGRKTCSLNHSRQSSVSSMQYSIMRIKDIPCEEMPELLDKCRRVFQLALLGTLAVPEVLERGTAQASTFADVQDKVEAGWLEATKVFQDNLEQTESIRRYLGVRWSAPKPRKSNSASARKASEDKAAQLSSPDVPRDPNTPDHMIIPGMNVAGFVSCEWAITQGTLFISISVPYSTGEQYEGAAHLINMLENRAHRERDELLANLNAAGRSSEATSIPLIQHSFTMIFFTRDSKYLAFLESKRQLLPLDRYLEKYPETDPKIFPPYRKVFLSDERKKDLSCLVRHLHPSTGDVKGKAVKATSRNVQQRKNKQNGA